MTLFDEGGGGFGLKEAKLLVDSCLSNSYFPREAIFILTFTFRKTINEVMDKATRSSLKIDGGKLVDEAQPWGKLR